MDQDERPRTPPGSQDLDNFLEGDASPNIWLDQRHGASVRVKSEHPHDEVAPDEQNGSSSVFALSAAATQHLLPSIETSDDTPVGDHRACSVMPKQEEDFDMDSITAETGHPPVAQNQPNTSARSNGGNNGSRTPVGPSTQPAMEQDEDDDLMITYASAVPASAQRERHSSRANSSSGVISDDVQAKQELPYLTSNEASSSGCHSRGKGKEPERSTSRETSQLAGPSTNTTRKPSANNELLARQRAMLAQAKPRTQLSASIFGPQSQSPPVLEPGARSALDEERDFFGSAMNATEEDDAWMHNDVEVDEEYEGLRKTIEELQKRKQNGKITQEERVKLYKAHSRISQKERLRVGRNVASDEDAEEEEPDEEEDSLFIPEDPDREERISRHRKAQGATTDEALLSLLEDVGEGSSKGPKAKKPPRKRAKDAREVNARKVEAERQKARNKAQRKKTRESSKKTTAVAKGKGGKKGAAGKTAPKKKGKATKIFRIPGMQPIDGQDNITQSLLNQLLDNDAIADRLQNPIFKVGLEPEINPRNKVSQLQQLIANVPESTRKQARGDRARLQEASQAFGNAKVRAQNGKWMIKGMKSPLYHHQLLGAQWMVSRELSDDPPHGGLLADGMGLGKTVQTLACMVGNPPCPADLKRGVKATLIVVPSSVINQWLEEIKVHADRKVFPKIQHYTSKGKISLEVLTDCDIVVTSYQEVMKQFPFPNKDEKEDKTFKEDVKAWWKKAEKRMGDLHKVNWYRVVLDEAHAIKNNSARTSLACQNLKSIFRWCLTGTPLLNRLEELYPYLRFLKANYTMNWETFRVYFCDSDNKDCGLRIATLLSYTMMRRTMSTTILGRPIITLPDPHPSIRFIDFSAQEKVIYRITENRFRATLNHYLASDTPEKAYGCFFVQLLRLRQCTSHPFMLERTIRDTWTTEDVIELSKKLSRKGINSVEIYKQCKLWVDEGEKERAERAARGESVGLDTMDFGISDFGKSFRFDKPIASLNAQDMFNRVLCVLCADMPTDALITDCGHIFCKECLDQHLQEKAALNDESDDFYVCPHCDKMFQECKPFKGPLSEEDSSSEDALSPAGSSSGSRQGSSNRKKNAKTVDDGPPSKGYDVLFFEPKCKDSTWVSRSDSVHDNFQLSPSAKTTALKAILLKGFDEAPLDKVVIYVQFRLLARIIGRICNAERWGFLYLTGDSTLEHRSNVVRRFREDPKIKILVAGLKCGGLGLNFPFANRCISLDLWWNHAIEQQAFGRIFRIGQKKETYMTRIIVKNSIDTRLLAMQQHKLATLEKAMSEGEEGLKKQLSFKELASLFGFLRTDEDDNIISVEADYDDLDDDDMVGGGGGSGSGSAREEGDIRMSGMGGARGGGGYPGGVYGGGEDDSDEYMDE